MHESCQMEGTNSTAGNCTFAESEATMPSSPVVCSPFSMPYFENLDTTVPYVVNAALNIPSILLATSENILVFFAIRRSDSIRFASKLLLCCLVLIDLGIGLLAQPGLVVLLFMKASGDTNPNCFLIKSVTFVASLLTNALLFTMTAISLDRYIALFFHFKYHQLVTSKRVAAVLASIWLVALFSALISIWNVELDNIFFTVSTLACFVTISVACIKIYRWLRRQYNPQVGDQGEAQSQQPMGNTLNVAKYRKTASALLWIYLLVIVCYLPHLCARLIKQPPEYRALTQCVQEFCVTLLLLNATLNPIVYFFHLPEIRAEVMKQIRKLCA